MSRRAQNLSSSLPSHFRYRSAPPTATPTSPFFNPNPEHDDPARCPIPAVDSSSAKTRLEALKGWEVSFAVLSLYFASAAAFIYVLFALHRAAFSWRMHHVIAPLTTFDIIIRYFLEFASVALPLYFVINLMLTQRLTDEQIWTCALLTVGLLATNPLTRDDISLVQPQRIIITDAIYTATVYLYLLMAAHSYRIVDPRRIHSLSFYAPKLAIAFSYVIVKLSVGFYARVSLGLIPFSRILTWLTLVRAHRATFRITAPVLLTACMDTAFVFWLVREVALTSEFLATVPYVEHRAKQLGFRCFVYQTLAFCINIVALALVINVGLPSSYLFFLCDNPSGYVVLEPPVARLGLAFVYFTWTLVLAYVNLPPVPLLLPALRGIVNRLVHPISESRFAVWFGLADVVTTADDEDSCDDDDDNDDDDDAPRRRVQPRSMHPITEFQTPSIPMRYRHHELYDLVAATPRPLLRLPSSPPHQYPNCINMSPIRKLSSAFGSGPASSQSPYCPPISGADDTGAGEEEYGDGDSDVSPSPPIAMALQQDTHIESTSSVPIEIPQQSERVFMDEGSVMLKMESNHRKRLRLRKNLFVMETQALMANAAYLSYIFGNPREELPRQNEQPVTPVESPSNPTLDNFNALVLDFEVDDDDDDEAIGGQTADEAVLGSTGSEAADSQQEEPKMENHDDDDDEVEETQPDRDDGTMFRVDPYEMAERFGYKVHRYISCERLNTHAVVLVGESRVMVAFSGTRDASNWRVNANINRAVLDDRLSRFEYEVGEDDSGIDDAAGLVAESQDIGFSFDGLDAVAEGLNTGESSGQSSVQRSLSDHDALARRATDIGMTPMTESARAKSYGTMGMNGSATVRRTVSEWLPNRRIADGCNAHGVWGGRTQSGMTMVASTFAHELLTFGKPKVHAGFLDAYMSIRKRVLGALLELYGGRYGEGVASTLPLFFCGHSLGGAMAIFGCYEAARYYKRIGISRRQDVGCTTFGCPRVGNEAFKMRYERLVETHWRFEMAADPIPKMPTVLLNYVPVGVQVLIDQSGMLLIDPSFIEVQWWGRLSNLYLGYRMHIRATYCMALRVYCKLYKNGRDDLAEQFWPFPIRSQTKGLFRQVQFDDDD